VNDGTRDESSSALAHPEQGWQPSFSQFIAKWHREAACYESGAMMKSPVGDMNRASAVVVRQMLGELVDILPPPASQKEE